MLTYRAWDEKTPNGVKGTVYITVVRPEILALNASTRCISYNPLCKDGCSHKRLVKIRNDNIKQRVIAHTQRIKCENAT